MEAEASAGTPRSRTLPQALSVPTPVGGDVIIGTQTFPLARPRRPGAKVQIIEPRPLVTRRTRLTAAAVVSWDVSPSDHDYCRPLGWDPHLEEGRTGPHHEGPESRASTWDLGGTHSSRLSEAPCPAPPPPRGRDRRGCQRRSPSPCSCGSSCSSPSPSCSPKR